MSQTQASNNTASKNAVAPPFKTGQKRCWDAEGNEISPEGSGQDGEYQAGLGVSGRRFKHNKNGTVTDNLTGLIWLKNANAFGEVMQPQARAHVRELADGMHGLTDGSKAGDWRLPNIHELQSLLSMDNSSGPALPSNHLFTNLETVNYWSSTSVVSAPPLGWYTAMAVGPPVFDLKINLMRMLPVRGEGNLPRTGQNKCYSDFGEVIPCDGTGQDGEIQAGIQHPEPRFEDHRDGTVTDNMTGLIWLKHGNPFGSRNWQQALTDCNNLASGSHGLADGSKAGDWRLPNVNELKSLLHYDNFGPGIPAGHPFTAVRSSLVWTSTTVASAPSLARFVFLGKSSAVWDHKSVQIGVWPVKGGLG